MYLDGLLLFAKGQALAGDGPSTNTIDLRDPRKVGIGENLYIFVAVTADLTGTLQVDLQSDDDDAFPSATVRDIGSFPANAPAGSALIYRINPADMDEQFARLDFNGATAGSVDAFITMDVDAYEFYKSGFTVTG